MEKITLNGIVYEVYDTPPEGFKPCHTTGTPSSLHALYSNGVPRYLFGGPEGSRINPEHRWALVGKTPPGYLEQIQAQDAAKWKKCEK